MGFAPASAALRDGSFVVTWAVPPTDSDPGAIEARLLDRTGRILGEGFSVNETPVERFGAEREAAVAVTALADGGFFVAWPHESEPGDGEIYGRRFSAEGAPRSGEVQISGGDERQINAESRGDQRSPSAAGLKAGGIAVAWESRRGGTVRSYVRLFDTRLEPLTSDLPVDEAGGRQESPTVFASDSGGFSVGWSTGHGLSRERRFDARGSFVSLATDSAASARRGDSCRSVARSRTGTVVETWIGDCSDLGVIYARGVDTIFADGFESGDTSAWSAREPHATLGFVSPSPGICLATATPSISLVFTDPAGGGLDPGSFLLTANGGGVFTTCTFGAGTIDCSVGQNLPEGLVVLLARVDDIEGHPATPASVSVSVDTVDPLPVDTGRVTVVPDGSGGVDVGGGPDAAEPGAEVTILNQVSLDDVTVTAQADGSFIASLSASEGDTLALTQADCGENTSSAVVVTVPGGGDPLPPNPPDVAPPIDPTVPTDFSESTEFLYTGPDPVQTGVTPGAIDDRYVAVLRGRVLNRDGAPIPGVKITCHGHPEVGQTLTRADGMFDLAVNGGDEVVLHYEKTGYLPIQRRVDAPWRDFAWAPDVVMVPLDVEVTTVMADATQLQVAEGSEVTDADGTRQAALLVPAGTEVEMVLPDGTTQPLSSMELRITEFTISDEGPAAMPGALPENVAYTWAAEISADEAIAAGASRVDFSQPVYLHLENFLDFPVGEPIPLGYYNREKAAWVGSDDGRVIEVLSVNGQGLAELDVDGTGQAADAPTLAALGFTDAERLELANRYSIGTTLWRAPIPHLTPWDCNWPYAPPEDAVPPPPDDDENPDDSDDPDPSEPVDPKDPETPPNEEQEENREEESDCQPGSIIDCQNQALKKRIVPPGTDIALHYASDRTPGYKAGLFLGIRLSGETVPTALRRIELEVVVGGVRRRESYPPLPNQTVQFSWDGTDGYGRRLQGERSARITKRYCYDLVYTRGTAFGRSWARWSSGEFETTTPSSRSNAEACIVRRRETRIGAVGPTLANWDSRGWGLGGWSISQHHTYDPQSRTLYLGTGEHYSVQPFALSLQSIVGGFFRPAGIAVGPGGVLYVADIPGHVIYRVDAEGTLSIVAGSDDFIRCGAVEPGDVGDTETECGNGGPATEAHLAEPFDVAVEGDGSLLIADHWNSCVRRVTPDGLISTVAGDCWDVHVEAPLGLGEEPCDSCPAIGERIQPFAVLPIPGGGFWISDTYFSIVRKVTPDGLIEREVGAHDAVALGDGGPARAAKLDDPRGLALDFNGNLYIADASHARVRKVTPEGIITTLAGNGDPVFSGEGQIASIAAIGKPVDVTVRRDGQIFITTEDRLLRIDGGGRVRTIAGAGTFDPRGPGVPASAAMLGTPWGIVEVADGAMYFADADLEVILQATDPLPGFSGDIYRIPDRAGREVYEFDLDGRHRRTLDSLTSAERAVFGYDAKGRLITITDGDGKVTEIERDAGGVPTAIVGPFGHRTEFDLDPNGWLSDITTPEGRNHHFSYAAEGLVLGYTDPRAETTEYTYLPSGQLKTVTSPALDTRTFTRFGFDEDYRVVLTTPSGLDTQYHVNNLATNDQSRTRTSPAGFATTTLRQMDGERFDSYPDGTVTETSRAGDSRFGMTAPFVSESRIRTPSGRERVTTRQRVVELMDPLDPLSLENITDTVAVNGRAHVRTFDAATATLDAISPEGRIWSSELDAQSRPVAVTSPGFATLRFIRDSLGRVETVRQGTGSTERTLQLDYDGSGRAEQITDPLLRSITFSYDNDNRVLSRVLPGNRVVDFTYNGNGNVETVTPPGRPAHAFGFTADGRLELYDPPDAGFSPDTVGFEYDEDRRLAAILFPDGDAVDLQYDGGGRLSLVTFPSGSMTYQYSPTTGNLETLTGPRMVELSYDYDGFLSTGTSWSGDVVGSVERTFSDDFWLESESVNGTDAVAFEYDDDRLLEGVGSLDVIRDGNSGAELGTTLGLVSTTVARDAAFHELDELAASYDGTEIFRIDFPVRDKLGRIVEREVTIGGGTDHYSYTYDTAGRLESVAKNGNPFSNYTYDDNGNRLTYSGPFGTISTTTYDDQDRLLSYGDTTFTYNKRGVLATKTQNGQTATYVYDALGNLRAVSLPDGIVVSYLVDGVGRRVGKKINGTLVQGFLYRDPLNPIAELDGAGVVVSRFVYGTRPHVPDYMVKGGVTYRIVSDHLGSVRLVVDVATGDIAQHLDYDEYGRVTANTNPGFQPFGFAGGLYDGHTKLIRFGLRDYDPTVGRWTARDPMLFRGGDTNLYAYAFNDPLNFVDPNGEAAIAVVGFVALVAITVAVVAIVTSPDYQENAREAADGLQKWWKDRVAPRPLPFPIAPGNDFPGYFDETCSDTPDVPFPGWDPTAPPREGTEWRGKPPVGGREGNWHDRGTGESWHPDLDHAPPKGPHWDYWDPSGNKWWVDPTGKVHPG